MFSVLSNAMTTTDKALLFLRRNGLTYYEHVGRELWPDSQGRTAAHGGPSTWQTAAGFFLGRLRSRGLVYQVGQEYGITVVGREYLRERGY